MSAACALELITCNYCENPALRFCDDCQVELCVDCVSKHIDQYGTLSHEIVRFIDKNDQLVIPECKHHPGRRCEAFSQQCQTPVCTKCLIGAHSSHNTEDIFSIVENKKKEIKKETKKIEDTLLRAYRRKYDNKSNCPKFLLNPSVKNRKMRSKERYGIRWWTSFLMNVLL